MRNARRGLTGVWLVAGCAGAGYLAGCAGAGFNGAGFQAEVARGQYDAALKSLDAFPKNDVSSLLDRALLLQAQGKLDESNRAFDTAELRIADLYTRSLSREALSLITNDRALEYRAAAYEHVYIAYFRSWNYLDRNDVEGTLVEARRINQRLDFLAASCPEEDGTCGNDVFLRYWSGLLFEWGHEPNDAYVCYKKAHEALRSEGEFHPELAPADLGERLVDLAGRMGWKDEAKFYAGLYGLDPRPKPASRLGTVVWVWENGFVGRREQATTILPILKGETEEIRKDQATWSQTLANRKGMNYDGVEVDYLLRISLPIFVDVPPRAGSADFETDQVCVHAQTLAPLSGMAQNALDRAMGGIVLRATARGLAKYLAKKTADKEVGKDAGTLVNLLGLALEQSDTRSWRSLPHEIGVAVLPVEPGTHATRIRVRGPDGQTLEDVTQTGVQVPAGGLVFLRHRTT
jgi:tetratricopeptide (TPR) repeat protein